MEALYTFLELGGVVMYLLVLSALLFFTLYFNKWMQLGVNRVKKRDIIETIEDNRALLRGMELLRVMPLLFPLIGLFATVLAMLMLFEELSHSKSFDKAQLSEGIYTAILPTMSAMAMSLVAIVLMRLLEYRLKKRIRQGGL